MKIAEQEWKARESPRLLQGWHEGIDDRGGSQRFAWASRFLSNGINLSGS